jgi:hypothetical protein
MQSVLTPVIELWNFGSPGGLPSFHFGSVNLIFTLSQSRVMTYDGVDISKWNLKVEPFVAQWIIQMKENMYELGGVKYHMAL